MLKEISKRTTLQSYKMIP